MEMSATTYTRTSMSVWDMVADNCYPVRTLMP